MSDWRGVPGVRWRHIEDGQNFIYIKTTAGTIVFTAALLIAFGYWLGL